MSIDSISGMGVSHNSPETTKPDQMGQDDFLTLLVTQLRAQDPLNPMDSAQFTAQLAQFSSLEQLMSVNTGLESLIQTQSSMNRMQSMDMIGKNIRIAGNSIRMQSGEAVLHFELAADAKAVYGSIYDENGMYIRTLESGPLKAGEQTLAWDGKDSHGNTVPEGVYRFEIAATDAEEMPVEAAAFAECRVTGIAFRNGQTWVESENMALPLQAVVRVTEENR